MPRCAICASSPGGLPSHTPVDSGARKSSPASSTPLATPLRSKSAPHAGDRWMPREQELQQHRRAVITRVFSLLLLVRWQACFCRTNIHRLTEVALPTSCQTMQMQDMITKFFSASVGSSGTSAEAEARPQTNPQRSARGAMSWAKLQIKRHAHTHNTYRKGRKEDTPIVVGDAGSTCNKTCLRPKFEEWPRAGRPAG